MPKIESTGLLLLCGGRSDNGLSSGKRESRQFWKLLSPSCFLHISSDVIDIIVHSRALYPYSNPPRTNFLPSSQKSIWSTGTLDKSGNLQPCVHPPCGENINSRSITDLQQAAAVYCIRSGQWPLLEILRSRLIFFFMSNGTKIYIFSYFPKVVFPQFYSNKKKRKTT